MSRSHPFDFFATMSDFADARGFIDDVLALPMKVGFPAYDLVKRDEDRVELRIAVAGYAPADLDISVEDRELKVSGRKSDSDQAVAYIHRGIAHRSFQRRFTLAEGVEVDSARLENGILAIVLKTTAPMRNVRKVEIAAAA